MFVHSVYFWLNEGLSPEQVAAFRGGLESLQAITDARECYVGVPVPSDRPVVDSSYSFALTVIFENKPAHDRYQVHPTHKQFVKDFGTFWRKIVVYDAQ